MSEIDPTEVVDWVWAKRDWLAKRLSDLRNLVGPNTDETDAATPESRSVLVIGSGGSGKSTLLDILTDQFDPTAGKPIRYNESLNVEVGVAESLKCDFTVLPGQEFRSALWQKPLEDLKNGRFRGVIYVTAGGYNSFGDGFQLARHPDYAGDLGEFVETYTTRKREEELRVLDMLSTPLTDNPSRTWMLVLCTKQDLWWPSRPMIHSHYLDGPFRDRLRSATSGCSRSRFRVETAFCSLVISNWITNRGELICENQRGFDQVEQVQSFLKLVDCLTSLNDWETEDG